MVKLYEGGAYLLHGTEVIADAPDALAVWMIPTKVMSCEVSLSNLI